MTNDTIGVFVLIGIAIFMVGNFMGAKPKPSTLKIENLRLASRGANLSPKIIATPFWLIANFRQLKPLELKQKSQAQTITQYTLIDDTLQLPQSCYRVQNKQWCWVDIDDSTGVAGFLDGKPVSLGDITPFVVGLAFKANSVILLWHDEKFAYQSDILSSDDSENLQLWQAFVADLKSKLHGLAKQ